MSVELVFERTAQTSLARAYRILVPERRSRSRHQFGSKTSEVSAARDGATEAEVTELASGWQRNDRLGGVAIELWRAQACRRLSDCVTLLAVPEEGALVLAAARSNCHAAASLF